MVAQRTRSSTTHTVLALHGDHLGSVSLATDASQAVVSRQDFDPWGSIRSGSISQTTLNYTGQRRDGTGLLYYHARYYDPALSRFISADSVVPGAPDGSLDGVALKPLTVDFHETGFVSGLNSENGQGFWFQNDDQVAPWGPANPQGLNRYAYVQNNPLRYTDPTGHDVRCFTPGCASTVTNLSDGPVEVIGDRRIAGCNEDKQACFESVSVVLRQGESTVEYGLVDADFIRPFDEHRLNRRLFFKGYGRESTFKVVDGMDVFISVDRRVLASCRTAECWAAIYIPVSAGPLLGVDPPGWYPASKATKPTRRLSPRDKIYPDRGR